VCIPPVLEDAVDPHVECLRRWRGFRKGVTNISTVDTLVLLGAKSKEKAQTGLFHTRGVGVIQSTYLATSSGTVADATSLFGLGFVSLDVVFPHPIEDGGVGGRGDRVSKHTLLGVLVELFVFACFPFRPVISSSEGSSRKFVCLGRTNIVQMAPDMVEMVEVELGNAVRSQVSANVITVPQPILKVHSV
jgi:hypothetical protein